jgi:hypothetical protein
VSAATRTAEVVLWDHTCGRCGGAYAISKAFRDQCFKDGKGRWHCPYCQSPWSYSESETTRLQRQLDSERKRTEWARQEAENERQRREAAEHRERAQKAAKTRLKNRIAHGVCPCCQRTFENLARHMETKHPSFAAAAGGES